VRISIIVPALNEAANITATLKPLQKMRARGHEVIVVDGGSHDGTAEAARPWADRVLVGERGRARQMNLGATAAGGDILWFLHADTLAPEEADALIIEALISRAWGRFDVRLSGRHPLLRVVARLINLRSSLSGIATGDQGICVRREPFAAVGGFPDFPLMEDVEISKRLKEQGGRPACLKTPLLTSSRRWKENGVVRTILLMWGLRAAYAMGVSPARLARYYR
jgi:rSAM/selenodomain-associated transferase 2